MDVVILVDGTSAAGAIPKYATVLDFQTAPSVANKTTLTKTD